MFGIVHPENHEMLAENVEWDDDRLANQTGGTAGDKRFDFRINATDRCILRQQVTHAFVRRDVEYTRNDLNGADPETSVKAWYALRFIDFSTCVYHTCRGSNLSVTFWRN